MCAKVISSSRLRASSTLRTRTPLVPTARPEALRVPWLQEIEGVLRRRQLRDIGAAVDHPRVRHGTPSDCNNVARFALFWSVSSAGRVGTMLIKAPDGRSANSATTRFQSSQHGHRKAPGSLESAITFSRRATLGVGAGARSSTPGSARYQRECRSTSVRAVGYTKAGVPCRANALSTPSPVTPPERMTTGNWLAARRFTDMASALILSLRIYRALRRRAPKGMNFRRWLDAPRRLRQCHRHDCGLRHYLACRAGDDRFERWPQISQMCSANRCLWLITYVVIWVVFLRLGWRAPATAAPARASTIPRPVACQPQATTPACSGNRPRRQRQSRQ